MFQNFALQKPVLIVIWLQGIANSKLPEKDREENQRDDVPAREEAFTRGTQMYLRLFQN